MQYTTISIPSGTSLEAIKAFANSQGLEVRSRGFGNLTLVDPHIPDNVRRIDLRTAKKRTGEETMLRHVAKLQTWLLQNPDECLRTRRFKEAELASTIRQLRTPVFGGAA